MRRYRFGIIVLLLMWLLAAPAAAQWLMGQAQRPSTTVEEQQGQDLYNKLRSGGLTCNQLTDQNYEVLGEFFMGRMLGANHAAMNQMMTQMLGSDGEEQMHVVMGKRLSGCDPSAQYPRSSTGFLPFMWMGGASPMMGPGWHGMYGYGALAWLGMLLFWGVVLLGIVALVMLLRRQGSGTATPLEILKVRYARGEIDKKEFEERRRELSV